MKRKTLRNILTTTLLMAMVISGCGSQQSAEAPASQDDAAREVQSVASEEAQGQEQAASGEKDVVTALLPPVSGTYQDKLNAWVEEFNAENQNIEIQVTTASWEDMTQKLDVQVNAGSPPDIAFIGYDGITKYLDSGMLVDIGDYLDESQLGDFDENVLNYFRNGDGLYGLPAYCEVQCIGGNRQFLEDAGIDWQSVQQNGWTYDEFREAIQKGVVMDGDTVKTYGFVFACSGVTAKDYFSIFVKNAGCLPPSMRI